MKTIYLLLLNSFVVTFSIAQENVLNSGGGEYAFYNKTTCVSDVQRQQIFNEIEHNRIFLEMRNLLPKRTQQLIPHPLFIWPVTKNPTAPYNNVWSISNYVDHNPNYPNAVQDWNCGERTYDTAAGYNHKGIDIFTWPFTWYMLDNNQAWAVAAADGVIIAKSDGNFDRNCAFNSGNWNAVYVQHADGSVAWYGHLKNGSLTSKAIGESVATGEFIGVLGSSGNSTGPHLHFEVYNASNQLVDTYTGACNTWTSSNDSWWISQKPYLDPKINAVLTHSQVYNFNTCPQTESTYFNDDFASGAPVIISIYLADQLPGTSGLIEIIRPDNSVAVSFVRDFTDFFYASYWYWTYNASTFNQSGIWTLRLTYQGNVVDHNFNYGTLANSDFNKIDFELYPNPASDFITIGNKNHLKIKKVTLNDVTGKTVFSTTEAIETINLAALSKGIYLISVESERGVYKNKIVKQ